jgi:hypothetical protein
MGGRKRLVRTLVPDNCAWPHRGDPFNDSFSLMADRNHLALLWPCEAGKGGAQDKHDAVFRKGRKHGISFDTLYIKNHKAKKGKKKERAKNANDQCAIQKHDEKLPAFLFDRQAIRKMPAGVARCEECEGGRPDAPCCQAMLAHAGGATVHYNAGLAQGEGRT